MKRCDFLAAGGAAVAASAGSGASAVAEHRSLRDRLTTRAESSRYLATSSSADVTAFLSALDLRGAPIARGSLGTSHDGHPIPYVVASRPMVSTPQQALDTGRPIVLLVGGVRGGEVEGKEALLALLRDLCVSTERTLLEDLVLVFVPVLNPDGNDALGAQATNRPLQNGPERVGRTTNGAGIDLDDDFIKAEAPETRALIDFVKRWTPHVFIDTRTRGGSFHGYGVTYAPSLHPAAYYGGGFVRDNVLPNLQKNLHDKFAIESFVSGHFGRTSIAYTPPPAESANYGWFAYDDRPRAATNYFGLRGIAAVRLNGYAHDALERRIYSVRAAVETILGYCSENDDAVVGSYTVSTRWLSGKLPVRGALPATTEKRAPVVWEQLAVASTASDEPGLPRGFKRTGNYTTATMPIFDRYVGTVVIEQPKGYLVPYEHASLVKPFLDRHGVVSETLVEPRRLTVRDFVVDTLERTTSAAGRATTAIDGHWQPASQFASRFGALYVPGGQALGPLASVLLEPESDDGIVVWNAFNATLKIGYSVPIFRVLQ